MLKKIFCLLILISMLSLASSYELTINSYIIGDDFTGAGNFIAGVSDSANDDLDFSDGRMLENPSYGIPLYSTMSGENFMIDYRSNLILNQPKIWKITQRGSREFRSLNNLKETVSWDLADVPSGVQIVLIDYGSDSTRSTIVKEINLKTYTSYEFEINAPYGEYRYFDLVMTSLDNNQETITSTTGSSGGGGGGSTNKNSVDSGSISIDIEAPIIEEKNSLEDNKDLTITKNSPSSFFKVTGAVIGTSGTTVFIVGAVVFLILIVIAYLIVSKRKSRIKNKIRRY